MRFPICHVKWCISYGYCLSCLPKGGLKRANLLIKQLYLTAYCDVISGFYILINAYYYILIEVEWSDVNFYKWDKAQRIGSLKKHPVHLKEAI